MTATHEPIARPASVSNAATAIFAVLDHRPGHGAPAGPAARMTAASPGRARTGPANDTVGILSTTIGGALNA